MRSKPVLMCILFLASLLFAGSASAQDVGDRMPQLNVTDVIVGEPGKMGRFGDGKVYAVDIWGTWCAPCRAIIPDLTKLQDKFRDKGLVVIGYSWEDPSVQRKFAAEFSSEIGYTMVADTLGKTRDELNNNEAIQGFPYGFLIGKDGKIVWKGNSKYLPKAADLFFAGKKIDIDDGPFGN